MVGWAMNSSHTQTSNIPAHRVVNREGLLTGKHHFGGMKVMQQLLESEGIIVVEDKIVMFDQVFWDPKKEMNKKKPQLLIPTASGKGMNPAGRRGVK
jgi:methylated-DNA-protein-cysteine methyltransferase-like protein